MGTRLRFHAVAPLLLLLVAPTALAAAGPMTIARFADIGLPIIGGCAARARVVHALAEEPQCANATYGRGGAADDLDLQQLLPLMCYAYLDAAHRWCEANVAGSRKPPEGRGAPECPIALPQTDHGATEKQVNALRPYLAKKLDCGVICKSFSLCADIVAFNSNVSTSDSLDRNKTTETKKLDAPKGFRPYALGREGAPAVHDPPKAPSAPVVHDPPKAPAESQKEEAKVAIVPGVADTVAVSSQEVQKTRHEKPITEKTQVVVVQSAEIPEKSTQKPPKIPPAAKIPPAIDEKPSTAIDKPLENNHKDTLKETDIDPDETDENEYNEDQIKDTLPNAGVQDSANLDAGPAIVGDNRREYQKDAVAINPNVIPLPYEEAQDSNFFYYFLLAIAFLILAYVAFHNKNKLLGLLVEGRRSKNVRRRSGGVAYRKLDCTLEEAVSSTPPLHGPNIVY